MLGLGLVGLALAERLIEAGQAVLGYDPDVTRAALLSGWAVGSPAALAEACSTIVVAVYDAGQIEEVLFGTGGVAALTLPRTFICITTCTPDRISALAKQLAGRGHGLVEFPLSGTSAQIRRGEATGLVAGEAAARADVARVLNILCPRRVELGAAGEAAKTKLGINLVLQLNRAAMAEGLAFAGALGIDATTFLAALSESAARSAVMAGKGPKMVARNYAPESRIAQTLKDADMILEQAAEAGQILPLMTAQRELLRKAVTLAGADADSSAVMEALRPGVPA
jgi:3-hydroxyisobutyrate dehydrogenase-like beta-hydroxyacid dehydrogenase